LATPIPPLTARKEPAVAEDPNEADEGDEGNQDPRAGSVKVVKPLEDERIDHPVGDDEFNDQPNREDRLCIERGPDQPGQTNNHRSGEEAEPEQPPVDTPIETEKEVPPPNSRRAR
jgi:hypothetical protein